MMDQMKQMPILLIFIYAFLQSSTAQDLICTVLRETNGQTTYRIPDYNQSKCHISWTDTENIILATQKGKKDGEVLFNNGTTLITRTCLKIVLYSRDCISEGIVQTATCNATCTGPAGHGSEKDPGTREIVTFVVIGFFVLACVLCVIYVWFRKKNRKNVCGSGVPVI